MAVTDLQSWADNLELVRLPGIETALVDLDTRQTGIELDWAVKSQQWTDALDLHTAQISAAQTDADLAQATSADTTTRVYGQEILLKTYVDNKIQLLRDEVSSDLALVDAYLTGDLQAYIDTQVAANLPSLTAALDAKLTEANAIVTQLGFDINDINGVNNTITNIQLPAITVETEGLRGDVDAVTAEFQTQFTDYPFVNVVDGLNHTQSIIAGQMQSLGHSVPRLPQSNWTIESSAPVLADKAPPLPAQFITDDPVFGDCVEFDAGLDQTIGQSYPIDFDTDRVYKLNVRLKVVSDGTLSGVQLAIGATTWNAGTVADLSVEKTLTSNNVTVANGEVTFTCYFSGNNQALIDGGYSIGSGPLNNAVHLPAGAANKAFFYIRQNVGAATDGQIRLALLEISEVTDTVAEATIRQDAIAGINGSLAAGILLRTKAGTAGAELELVSADDPVNGAASLARISADDIVLDGTVTTAHLRADVLVADNIVAGLMSVNRIHVDDILSIDESNGGFAMGKPNAYDVDNDGIYMGRTLEPDLSTGFGLSATKTNTATGLKQHFSLTQQTGLNFQNAQFSRQLNIPGSPITYTSNYYAALPAGTQTIDISLMGGGGGGGSGANVYYQTAAGAAGGTTTVQIYDGGVLQYQWNAGGGAGGSGWAYGFQAPSGGSSVWGSGGAGGMALRQETSCTGGENSVCTTTTIQGSTNGGNATGYGGGGGGGGTNVNNFYYNGNAGARGNLLQINAFDISHLANPMINIIIGGAGAPGSAYLRAGGWGSQGRVDVIANTTAPRAADVIPLAPTAVGSFDSGAPFPPLGAGLWHVASTNVSMYLGWVNYNGLLTMRLHEDNSSRFISDRTLTKHSFIGGYTIYYSFHKMGQ